MTAVIGHDARRASEMRELWNRLGASMRLLREQVGMSLRKVEEASGVGRGTLSQVETGKARPNRYLVEWYDTTFGGDGVLLSMFAEARGAHGPTGTARRDAVIAAGDALTVVAVDPHRGQLVACGSVVRVRWTVRNAGSVPWRRRRLARVGPRAGLGLLASLADEPMPDCDPGDEVTAAADVSVPAEAATYVAFWQVAHADGDPALPIDVALSVELVARHFD